MTKSIVKPPARPGPDTAPVQAVTLIMGTVVASPSSSASATSSPSPSASASQSGSHRSSHPRSTCPSSACCCGTRHLALHGATPQQLRPARRLLIFASFTTLALNIADPLLTGAYGKAAFDAVGPLLLIGWAEIGPGLLQAISTLGHQPKEAIPANRLNHCTDLDGATTNTDKASTIATGQSDGPVSDTASRPAVASDHDLIEQARREDARHWLAHQRPISAETLRKNLHISAARSRQLVTIVRAERPGDRNPAMAPAGQPPSE
jgi:hypothetical protein